MFISVLSAPMYVDALVKAVRNRNVSFKVTPKGDGESRDGLASFSRHLWWAAFLASALALSLPLGNSHPFMRGWAVLALTTCLMPVLIWGFTVLRDRRRGPEDVERPVGPQPVTPVPRAQPVYARVGSATDHLQHDRTFDESRIR
jgi:hypothetical protein